MMPPNVLSLALTVLRQASRTRPADGVLRDVLRKERGLPPSASAAVARAVFAAGRWRGWLDDPLDVSQALALQDRYRRDPASFSDDELLARAVPEWVKAEMPVEAAWVRALQAEPVLWLRARPGRAGELARTLGDCRLSQQVPDAVTYLGRRDLFRTPAFQSGAFEVQDISSQAVGRFCGARAGETWWDACAGEGGKTMHLSDLMANQGLIWASDRVAWRLKRLKMRAARARVFNYRAVPWDGGAKLPTKTKFDGVLVDAPCSGLGTWQRNPHARWTTTPQDVRELAAVQERLLAQVAPALKPGGRLVYAVCTLLQAECEAVVTSFSNAHPELQPLALASPFASSAAESTDGLRWWPQGTGGNGMFVAAWRRTLN